MRRGDVDASGAVIMTKRPSFFVTATAAFDSPRNGRCAVSSSKSSAPKAKISAARVRLAAEQLFRRQVGHVRAHLARRT